METQQQNIEYIEVFDGSDGEDDDERKIDYVMISDDEDVPTPPVTPPLNDSPYDEAYKPILPSYEPYTPAVWVNHDYLCASDVSTANAAQNTTDPDSSDDDDTLFKHAPWFQELMAKASNQDLRPPTDPYIPPMVVRNTTPEEEEQLEKEFEEDDEYDPGPVMHLERRGFVIHRWGEWSAESWDHPGKCLSAAMVWYPPTGECHHDTLIASNKMGPRYPSTADIADAIRNTVFCPRCGEQPKEILLSNSFDTPLL